MDTIGRHLIAEFYGCDAAVLDDLRVVRTHMLEAAHRVGATVVGDTFHKFANHGVSGTVVVTESHLSIHTWPETGYVAVDIYTCGGLDPNKGCEYLGWELGATSCRLQELLRGVAEEVERCRPLTPSAVCIVARDVKLRQLRPPVDADQCISDGRSSG